MFYVFDNAVYPEKSEVLFHDDFRGKVGDNWEVAGGGWTMKDGLLSGCIRENRGGLIYSHGQYPGDIMLDFYGTLVSPCKNDLNFTFRAEGWDRFENNAGTSYIGGLGGWWTGRTGIEKYPDCRVQALTSAFTPQSGQELSLIHISNHLSIDQIEDFAWNGVIGYHIQTPLHAENGQIKPNCPLNRLSFYYTSFTIYFNIFRILFSKNIQY